MPNLTAVLRQETEHSNHFAVPLAPPFPGPLTTPLTMPRRARRLGRKKRGVRGKSALSAKARLRRAVQGRYAANPTPSGVIRAITGNMRGGPSFKHITDRLTKIEQITAGADSQ
jgi:hypothetical protein